jgi:hypothetical protein
MEVGLYKIIVCKRTRSDIEINHQFSLVLQHVSDMHHVSETQNSRWFTSNLIVLSYTGPPSVTVSFSSQTQARLLALPRV